MEERRIRHESSSCKKHYCSSDTESCTVAVIITSDVVVKLFKEKYMLNGSMATKIKQRYMFLTMGKEALMKNKLKQQVKESQSMER